MERKRRRSIENLGLSQGDKTQIKKLLNKPSGLIVVAAPAGNGKTTTLISVIPYQSKNIFAIESSIETVLPHVSQTLVSRDGPNSYQSALENIDSQDTDVIMVDTIASDKEIQLTIDLAGANLMLTSIPFENAAQVIMHLIRSQGDSMSVAHTLKMVISQRLVPLICSNCKIIHSKSRELADKINIPQDIKLQRGAGCPRCYFTGRKGRVMLFQTVFIDDKFAELIANNPTFSQLVNHIKRTGKYGFRYDALIKCQRGWIHPEDVLKFS